MPANIRPAPIAVCRWRIKMLRFILMNGLTLLLIPINGFVPLSNPVPPDMMKPEAHKYEDSTGNSAGFSALLRRAGTAVEEVLG